jgi:hypothetical protein
MFVFWADAAPACRQCRESYDANGGDGRGLVSKRGEFRASSDLIAGKTASGRLLLAGTG